MVIISQVSVIDAAAMGEVIDTFPVCATPLCCICAIPAFDSEVTTGQLWRGNNFCFVPISALVKYMNKWHIHIYVYRLCLKDYKIVNVRI